LLILLRPELREEVIVSDDEEREAATSSARPSPDPAQKALDEPHLSAEDLEREIGDSEAWDEASDGDDNDR
jgi:hypothetical protein